MTSILFYNFEMSFLYLDYRSMKSFKEINLIFMCSGIEPPKHMEIIDGYTS